MDANGRLRDTYCGGARQINLTTGDTTGLLQDGNSALQSKYALEERLTGGLDSTIHGIP
jgi:hypothetical protein